MEFMLDNIIDFSQGGSRAQGIFFMGVVPDRAMLASIVFLMGYNAGKGQQTAAQGFTENQDLFLNAFARTATSVTNSFVSLISSAITLVFRM